MNAAPAFGHEPVMIDEVIAALQPRVGGHYVDGTFGAGGYTTAILEAADCRVWAIDRDPDAVASAATLLDRYAGRLTVIEGRFGTMTELLAGNGIDAVDGIALDRQRAAVRKQLDGLLDKRAQRGGTVHGLDEVPVGLADRQQAGFE